MLNYHQQNIAKYKLCQPKRVGQVIIVACLILLIFGCFLKTALARETNNISPETTTSYSETSDKISSFVFNKISNLMKQVGKIIKKPLTYLWDKIKVIGKQKQEELSQKAEDKIKEEAKEQVEKAKQDISTSLKNEFQEGTNDWKKKVSDFKDAVIDLFKK